jgi:hypothetical protein
MADQPHGPTMQVPQHLLGDGRALPFSAWPALPIGSGYHSMESPVCADAAFITLTHSDTILRPMSSPSRISTFSVIFAPTLRRLRSVAEAPLLTRHITN